MLIILSFVFNKHQERVLWDCHVFWKDCIGWEPTLERGINTYSSETTKNRHLAKPWRMCGWSPDNSWDAPIWVQFWFSLINASFWIEWSAISLFENIIIPLFLQKGITIFTLTSISVLHPPFYIGHCHIFLFIDELLMTFLYITLSILS